MISYNRWRGTFEKDVNRYIALTKFAANRLIAGGLPADRIEVKPNFLPNAPVMSKIERTMPSMLDGKRRKGYSRTLLAAWQVVSGLPLKVLGDGRCGQAWRLKQRKRGSTSSFWDRSNGRGSFGWRPCAPADCSFRML
jgi:hypothetical protein